MSAYREPAMPDLKRVKSLKTGIVHIKKHSWGIEEKNAFEDTDEPVTCRKCLEKYRRVVLKGIDV